MHPFPPKKAFFRKSDSILVWNCPKAHFWPETKRIGIQVASNFSSGGPESASKNRPHPPGGQDFWVLRFKTKSLDRGHLEESLCARFDFCSGKVKERTFAGADFPAQSAGVNGSPTRGFRIIGNLGKFLNKKCPIFPIFPL
jgi:hypothetical protein